MEHVTITPEAGRQVHLTAEKGYLLRSNLTGREYTEISTRDMNRWKVVKKPAAKKPAGGKPQTQKEPNSKQ